MVVLNYLQYQDSLQERPSLSKIGLAAIFSHELDARLSYLMCVQQVFFEMKVE